MFVHLHHCNGRHSTNSRFSAKVRPPRAGGEKTGCFATRSPHRVNPIGLVGGASTRACSCDMRRHLMLFLNACRQTRDYSTTIITMSTRTTKQNRVSCGSSASKVALSFFLALICSHTRQCWTSSPTTPQTDCQSKTVGTYCYAFSYCFCHHCWVLLLLTHTRCWP